MQRFSSPGESQVSRQPWCREKFATFQITYLWLVFVHPEHYTRCTQVSLKLGQGLEMELWIRWLKLGPKLRQRYCVGYGDHPIVLNYYLDYQHGIGKVVTVLDMTRCSCPPKCGIRVAIALLEINTIIILITASHFRGRCCKKEAET